MRERMAFLAITGIGVWILVMAVTFAVVRSAPLAISKMDEAAAGHSHTAQGQPPATGHRAESPPAPSPAEKGGDPPRPSGKIEDGVRVIELKARKFEFDPSTIVVYSGEKVRILATAEDVDHGFGLLDYDITETLKKGETKKIEFEAKDPGSHDFFCTVYCGKGHGDMTGTLVVLPAAGGKAGS